MYINNSCHMNQLAATPIYGKKKNVQNIPFGNMFTVFNKAWNIASVLDTKMFT